MTKRIKKQKLSRFQLQLVSVSLSNGHVWSIFLWDITMPKNMYIENWNDFYGNMHGPGQLSYRMTANNRLICYYKNINLEDEDY